MIDFVSFRGWLLSILDPSFPGDLFECKYVITGKTMLYGTHLYLNKVGLLTFFNDSYVHTGKNGFLSNTLTYAATVSVEIFLSI